MKIKTVYQKEIKVKYYLKVYISFVVVVLAQPFFFIERFPGRLPQTLQSAPNPAQSAPKPAQSASNPAGVNMSPPTGIDVPTQH